MRAYVGTSGWSYKEWKGSFYPGDLPPDEMLRYYATRLLSVEVNNSFYRVPSERVVMGWADQVPANFRFVLKASRRITHINRLTMADAGRGEARTSTAGTAVTGTIHENCVAGPV